jgi:hypothetical protein
VEADELQPKGTLKGGRHLADDEVCAAPVKEHANGDDQDALLEPPHT